MLLASAAVVIVTVRVQGKANELASLATHSSLPIGAQRPCPLLHHISRAKKLLSAAGNSGPSRAG
jgi:hypothetical protein